MNAPLRELLIDTIDWANGQLVIPEFLLKPICQNCGERKAVHPICDECRERIDNWDPEYADPHGYRPGAGPGRRR